MLLRNLAQLLQKQFLLELLSSCAFLLMECSICAGAYLNKTADNKYFLFGVRDALDAPGEWYYNSTAGKLHVWMPGAKCRQPTATVS